MPRRIELDLVDPVAVAVVSAEHGQVALSAPAVLERLEAARHGAGLTGAVTPLAVFLAFIFGGALGAVLIPAFTLLQERTTAETRGRIFGGIFTVINAAVAIPLLLAGVLADVLGVDRVVAALGVILLLLAVLIRSVGWTRLAVLEDDTRDVELSVVEPG